MYSNKASIAQATTRHHTAHCARRAAGKKLRIDEYAYIIGGADLDMIQNVDQPKTEMEINFPAVLNITSLYDIINFAKSHDVLWEEVYNHLEDFGISALSYYHIPPIGLESQHPPLCVVKLPPEGHPSNNPDITEKNFFLLASKARHLTSPLCLDQIESVGNSDRPDISFLKSVQDDDKMKLVLVPVFGPLGRAGFVILETETLLPFRSNTLLNLQSIFAIAHLKSCELENNPNKSAIQLTAREREILIWIARGKSNSVIGEILNISVHTVNGYLRSVFLKTNTFDRTSAVVKCIGEGLLQF